MKTTDEIFQYISDFYRTTDQKLDFIIKAILDNRKHMTGLYAFDCDVNALPAATGHLRVKQMAVLKLLRVIDSVLRKNNIPYFLGYGNLLGAARTGDFIPWDDDVDICLMRNDFDRAIPILQREFNKDGFETRWGISGRIFKVIYVNKICVDLFPWDTYYTRMNKTELDEFDEKYTEAMRLARELEFDMHQAELDDAYQPMCKYNSYDQIRDDVIMNGKSPDYENGDIFEAIDWQTYPERAAHFFHKRPFRREYIFPLGEIEFCGYKFPAPNNVDAWLTTRFGDWHEFKPEFNRHSGAAFTWEELEELKQFSEKDI
jgi:lipopolysaccharide cholinephosphotransferase